MYDYLLPAAIVSGLANAYGLNIPPPAAQASYAFPATAETTNMLAVVPRAPILNGAFAQNPTTAPGIPYTNYVWQQTDGTDPQSIQQLHQGVLQLNGSNPSYVDLSTATGPQSCGLVLPLIGLPGSGVGTSQGLSFEIVFKYPSSGGMQQSSKIFDFAQGGSETVDLSFFPPGSGSAGSQLQLEQQNRVAPGVEPLGAYLAAYTNNVFVFQPNTWYHLAWVLSSPSFSNYTATWTFYVNGFAQPLTVNGQAVGTWYVNGLFPLPVTRPLAYLAGAAYDNANLPIWIDTFRIYDYALQPERPCAQLSALALPPTTAPGGSASCSAIPFAAASGDAVAASVVSRAAIFNANFTSTAFCVTSVSANWQWQANDHDRTRRPTRLLHQRAGCVLILNDSASSELHRPVNQHWSHSPPAW